MIGYTPHTMDKASKLSNIQNGEIQASQDDEQKLLLEVMAEMRIADRINQVSHG